MEFNLYKQELLQGIAAAETFEEAHKAWEAMCRKARKMKTSASKNKEILQMGNPSAYTMEEINARIDHSLAGKSVAQEDVKKRMEQRFPWLCE